MRASMHNGRTGSANHNDRQFDLDKADHINQTKSLKNAYTALGHLDGDTFREKELDYYRKTYSAGLEARNERYRAQRHPERCRTIEDLYRDAKTRPEEQIMQIGDHLDSVPRKILMQCLNDYIRVMNDWSKSHGMPFVILDVALHMDETTPHVHIRRVWNGHDKDGNLIPNQNDALERAGVELPDPSKKEGRYNNRKMAFDAWAREQWQQIIKAHGIEIETVPIEGRRHLDKDDFIREQAAQAMALRDSRQAEAVDAIKDQIDGINNTLRTADKTLPEPIKVLPAVKGGFFRREQPERVILSRESYDAAQSAVTAVAKGKALATHLDKDREDIQRAAKDIRLDRSEAHELAIDDRVRASDLSRDEAIKQRDEMAAKLQAMTDERDKIIKERDILQAAIDAVQAVLRFVPSLWKKLQERTKTALEMERLYKCAQESREDPAIHHSSITGYRFTVNGTEYSYKAFLQAYQDECKRNRLEPLPQMTKHLENLLKREERDTGVRLH